MSAAQLGLEEMKGACGTQKDAEGKFTSFSFAELELFQKAKRNKTRTKYVGGDGMGRYKSVLRAKQDARDFRHHVELPIPGHGLGKRLDVLSSWLNETFGDEWRLHGKFRKGEHTAYFMFRTPEAARMFRQALGEQGELRQL